MSTEGNPLLQNLDRAVFTFNMHNLSEMCFNHVFKNKPSSANSGQSLHQMPPNGKLSEEQQ